MRFTYSRVFLLFCFVLFTATVSACSCSFVTNNFCGLYGPNARVYRANIIEYVVIPNPDVEGWNTPTVKVEIIEILNGPDDLESDTLTLVGQDGLNCAANLPLAYQGEIIFLLYDNSFFDEYWSNQSIGFCAELSGCGPSSLGITDGQVFGPIGGSMSSGVTLTEFVENLDEMGNCALSVDVAEQGLTAADLQVYPNPVKDRVFIDLTNLNTSVADLNVSLVNTMGKTIRQQSFVNTAGPVDLDVTNLPAGIYFLRITTDLGEVTKRIVIN